MNRPPLGPLHVLTDARGGPQALAAVAAAVAAGAPVVQVRAKDCTDRVLYEFAGQVVDICRPAGATCLVNDRVDVALAAGAYGTHLGADDLPLAAAASAASLTALMTATPQAPAAMRSGTRAAVTPPIAMTGTSTAVATARTPAGPSASGSPVFVVVGHAGPTPR